MKIQRSSRLMFFLYKKTCRNKDVYLESTKDSSSDALVPMCFYIRPYLPKEVPITNLSMVNNLTRGPFEIRSRLSLIFQNYLISSREPVY